jgi:hypothetical protein
MTTRDHAPVADRGATDPVSTGVEEVASGLARGVPLIVVT